MVRLCVCDGGYCCLKIGVCGWLLFGCGVGMLIVLFFQVLLFYVVSCLFVLWLVLTACMVGFFAYMLFCWWRGVLFGW